MTGKTQTRLAVLAALVALFAGALVAQADVDRLLTLEVTRVNSPNAITTAETPTDFEFKITNHQDSDKDLGAVEIEIAHDEEDDDVAFLEIVVDKTSIEAAEGAKTWLFDDSTNGRFVRLVASSSADRLIPGESVTVTIELTPPNNSGGDTIYDMEVVGRQATDFNDEGAPGNTFVEVEGQAVRGPFEVRNEDGTTTETKLRTDQVLVTGIAVDCSGNKPCSGTLTQFETTVTVTATCGPDGTLVVDTIEVDSDNGEIGAGAFYNAFSGCDVLAKSATEFDENHIVTVDIQYESSVVDNRGSLEFAADYPEEILGDPDYVGNGNTLPACKQDITVNCVEFVKGGPGVVNARVKMLLTDPALIGRN